MSRDGAYDDELHGVIDHRRQNERADHSGRTDDGAGDRNAVDERFLCAAEERCDFIFSIKAQEFADSVDGKVNEEEEGDESDGEDDERFRRETSEHSVGERIAEGNVNDEHDRRLIGASEPFFVFSRGFAEFAIESDADDNRNEDLK